MAGRAVPLEHRGLSARVRGWSRGRARPQRKAEDRRRGERKPSASRVPGVSHETQSLTAASGAVNRSRPARAAFCEKRDAERIADVLARIADTPQTKLVELHPWKRARTRPPNPA